VKVALEMFIEQYAKLPNKKEQLKY